MAPLSLLDILLILTALTVPALSQTFTSCNPLKVICPSDPALGTTFNTTYNAGSSLSTSYWSTEGSRPPTFPLDNTGMAFTIYRKGDGPTIQSAWYTFWGHVSVLMKAAPGTGIISSIVLLSDDLDEIDWEIMGGNTTHVETNYYGKGDQEQMNAIYYPVDIPPQDKFYNYTINWNSEKVEWILDGNIVRMLTFDEAVDKNKKTMFPQTPMRLKIGNWAGGASSQPGTVEWAGGPTDFGKAPFTMMVQGLRVVDGMTNVTDYSYGDMTGSWESIKMNKGISQANEKIHAPPPLSPKERWEKLGRPAQIAIAATVIGVTALLVVLYVFCCIKHRRAGKRERMLADSTWEKEQAELLAYKRQLHEQHFKKGPAVGVQEFGTVRDFD